MSLNPNNYGYGKSPDLSPKSFSGYACKEITVTSGVVDYSLKTYTELFSVVSSPIQTLIRNGSSGIRFKFNSSSNDSIPLAANADWGIEGYIITDILVTTSGAASFDVFTLGWR
jgi:hypothetical protein